MIVIEVHGLPIHFSGSFHVGSSLRFFILTKQGECWDSLRCNFFVREPPLSLVLLLYRALFRL